MKHFSLLKNISLACLTLGAVAGMSSCTHPASPASVNRVLQNSTSATVYSYNDSCTVAPRVCKPAGPLPARASRALQTWLHYSTAKQFSYAYPQYYLSLVGPDGKQQVWGLCSDAHGNFVGIMVQRGDVPAWDVPFGSNHIVYVCDETHREGLSVAIMDSLKEYDTFRISTRKASGLDNVAYLISAPTDENAQRAAKIKEAKEQAKAAKDQNNEKAMEGAEEDSGDLGLESFASPDDSSSSDDDASFDEDDSSDEE